MNYFALIFYTTYDARALKYVKFFLGEVSIPVTQTPDISRGEYIRLFLIEFYHLCKFLPPPLLSITVYTCYLY